MKVIMLFMLVVCIIISVNISQLSDYIYSGKIFYGNDVSINMKDVSWDKLPLGLKEYISRASFSTRVNRDELKELAEFYKKLSDEYAEPVNLKTEFKKSVRK